MADLVYLVTFFKSFFSSLRHHSCFEWTNPYFENSAVANQLAIGLFTSRVSRAGRLTGQVSVERLLSWSQTDSNQRSTAAGDGSDGVFLVIWKAAVSYGVAFTRTCSRGTIHVPNSVKLQSIRTTVKFNSLLGVWPDLLTSQTPV